MLIVICRVVYQRSLILILTAVATIQLVTLTMENDGQAPDQQQPQPTHVQQQLSYHQ